MPVVNTIANKKRKLEKHVKSFSKDLQAKKALEKFNPKERKAPLTKKWNSQTKRLAKMAKFLGYKGNSVLSESGHWTTSKKSPTTLGTLLSVEISEPPKEVSDKEATKRHKRKSSS